MSKRAQQLADTRQKIIKAAIEVFSDLGFEGASTRDIAALAGTNQGLITYHFKSKDELWRAAAHELFSRYRERLLVKMSEAKSDGPRQLAREYVREYVYFAGAHPEFFLMMIEEGKRSSDRMRWLVKTHLKPMYDYYRDLLSESLELDEESAARFIYMLIGAGGLIFAHAPAVRKLTGLNATTRKSIQAHADHMAELFVP